MADEDVMSPRAAQRSKVAVLKVDFCVLLNNFHFHLLCHSFILYKAPAL